MRFGKKNTVSAVREFPYDPDRHIIEVGENMKAVCRRFIDSGMTPEQTAVRMDVPVAYVNDCIQ